MICPNCEGTSFSVGSSARPTDYCKSIPILFVGCDDCSETVLVADTESVVWELEEVGLGFELVEAIRSAKGK
jgi:hypothetical protein